MTILVPDAGISAPGPAPATVFKSHYGKIAFCMGRPSEQYDNSGAGRFLTAKSEYVVRVDGSSS